MRAQLLFNFIGVAVVDWDFAFRFFGETLGFHFALEPKHGNWAVFGKGWDAYYREAYRGCVFELFDQGRGVSERFWGFNQGIRPGFHVSNLQKVLSAVDIPWVVSESPWGRVAEGCAPEGIRFAFAEIPQAPYSNDLRYPYIGHVAIRCVNFEAMQDFYGGVLGFSYAGGDSDFALYKQPDGHPWVILERGGQTARFDVQGTPWEADALRAFPVFLSLMTNDIQAVSRGLRSHSVILREIRSHADWGGTDLHIADPDGNALQVVQYHQQDG